MKKRAANPFGLLLVWVLGLLLIRPPAARAAVFEAGTELELAAAIESVNAAGPGAHRIALLADITLTGPLPDLDNALSATLLVQGNGHTLRGDDAHTVLVIERGTTVTLARLTITGGRGSEGAAGDQGGGIYNEGDLRLELVTLTGNSAASGGGLANIAGEGQPASATLIRSTVSGNSAGRGGGLLNEAPAGAEAGLTLVNTTLSGNLATDGPGGGILNASTGGSAGTILLYTTVAANAAAAGGGNLHATSAGGPASIHLTASLIALATGSGEACAAAGGYLISTGFNLDEDGSCRLNLPSDVPRGRANLGPLEAGPGDATATHALGFRSDALDAVAFGAMGCGGTYASDQRGKARPETGGGRCDIGAYEAGSIPQASDRSFTPFVSR